MGKGHHPTVAFRMPQEMLARVDEIAEEQNSFRSDVLKVIITTHPMFKSQGEGAAA